MGYNTKEREIEPVIKPVISNMDKGATRDQDRIQHTGEREIEPVIKPIISNMDKGATRDQDRIQHKGERERDRTGYKTSFQTSFL